MNSLVLFTVFALLSGVITSPAAAAVAQRRTVHACVLAYKAVVNASSVQHFVFSTATEAQFPHLQVVPKLLAQASSVGVLHGIGVALARSTENCTVLVGPGKSAYVRASAILVDAPLWVGSVESWAEFSINGQYPQFNRVGMSTLFGGNAVSRFLAAYEWRHVNLLCIDSTEGLNFQAAAVHALAARSVTIGQQDSVPEKKTFFSALRPLIDAYRASNTRVIVASVNDIVLGRLLTVLEEKNLMDYFYFVFAPDVCALPTGMWKQFPGAFCVTLPVNSTRLSAFEARYHARTDRAEFAALLSTAGVASEFHPSQHHALSMADVLAHDAAYFALAGLDWYWGARQGSAFKLQPPGLAQAMRFTNKQNGTIAPAGLTGAIKVDNKGDRPELGMVVENAAVNTSTNATVIIEVARVVTRLKIEKLGAAFYAERGQFLEKPPSHLSPEALAPPPPPPPPDYTTVVGVVTTAVALAAIFSAVLLVWWLLRRRALQRFPRDDSKPFAVVFFSIKNEVAIRTQNGTTAAFAMCSHVVAIIEKAATAEGCVVARKLDAHFMVVSRDAGAAFRCAGRVARTASEEKWSTVLFGSSHHDAPPPVSTIMSDLVVSPSATPASPEAIRSPPPNALSSAASKSERSNCAECDNVPQIGAGIAFGVGCITTSDNDPFDVRYGGAPVEQAAVLTDAAQPYQILVSGDAESHAADRVSDGALNATDAAMEEFTNIVFPGTTEAEPVFQLDPSGLPRRTFVALADKDSDDAPCAPAVGSLSSAMEEATGGLATRPVAVTTIVVPELQQRQMLLTDAHSVLRIVASAADHSQGTIVSATGGEFVVAVNATGRPVSQTVTRAATIAMRATAAIAAAGFTAHAGVDCSAAAVGDDHVPAVLCCIVAERSLALARLARTLDRTAADCSGVTVVASAATSLELHFAYSLRAVDICVWRNPGAAFSSTQESPGAKRRSKPVLAYSVHPQGSVAEDEWMYQLDSAEQSNAAGAENAALTALAAGDATIGLQLLGRCDTACAVGRVLDAAGITSALGIDNVLDIVAAYGAARIDSVTAHHGH